MVRALPVPDDGSVTLPGAATTAPSEDASGTPVEHQVGTSLYGIDLGIPLADRRILVADPSPFSRKTLTRFLTWIGIRDIVFVSDGREVQERAADIGADLILLDADLGSLSGIETCRALRATPAGRDMPILLQTTSHSDQTRARCFQAGANDVITKPVNPGELIARLRYHLERRAMVMELRGFRERIERDLAMARSMQLALIPKPERVAEVARKRGLTIASRFESCDEIGGDFWSLYEIDENRIGVLVADFSGHGIAAAINAFRFETLASRCSKSERADPGMLLTKLNQELCGTLAIGQYCTVFYGVLDSHKRTLTYACGAQPSPFLGGKKNGLVKLDGSGTFLGCWPEEHYENRRQTLENKGFLFLYSDVLTESPDHDGNELGEDGLEELVRKVAPTEHPLDTLLEHFALERRRPYHDDLTAVWIAWS
ncbi:MAG: SpoIIE family protein phosphatase [Rhodospirillaceae bacterium]